MNKVIDIVQILIENSKYKEVFDEMKEIKQVAYSDNVEMQDIMKLVNNKNIKPYESFYVFGYLSRTACLDVPETYVCEKRKYSEFKNYCEKGNLQRAIKMSVNKNNLPQCQPYFTKDTFVAFLYKDKKKRFEATKDEHNEEILNSYQQFIPVIMDEEKYYKYVDNYVRLKVQVMPLGKYFDEDDLIIENSKYSYLNELFYDIYQPYVTFFFLKCLDVSVDITLNVGEEEVRQFVVEYEILAHESTKGLANKVSEFTYKKEYGNFPKGFEFEDGQILFLSDKGVSICVKEKKIGFYKELNISDSKTYKNELKEFESYIKSFFKKYRLINEISFISDLKKKKIFEI